MALLNLGGAIAQFQRNDCSISPVEVISGSGVRTQNRLALWAERISECRNSGQNIKTWCRENGICEQTYYKWQRRLVEMAQAQQALQFADITPTEPVRSGKVAVTVRIAEAEADIHSGADAATVETVLRILKSC